MVCWKLAMISLFLCIPWKLALSQIIVDWSTTFGGSSWDQEPIIRSLPEGGCLVLGTTYSSDGYFQNSLGNADIVVLRLDENGNVLWQERFGGDNTDLASDMVILPDGGAVICGRSKSNNGIMEGVHKGLFDVLVFRISKNGSLIWSNAFGGTNSDHANAVCPHPYGGFVLACKSNSFDGDTSGQIPSHDIWILHIDEAGNLIQQSTLGSEFGIEGYSSYEYANDLVISNDQNLVVLGSSNAVSTDYDEDGPIKDQYIAKLNSDLDLVWETFVGGMYAEEIYSAFPTDDGGVMAVGFTYSPDFNESTASKGGGCLGTIIKINSFGEIEWARFHGGDNIDRIHDICPGNQGGWYAIGVSESSFGQFSGNNGQADLWFLQYNEDGQLENQELMGGSQNDRGNSIAKDMQTGRLYLAGTTLSADGDLSQNQGNGDFWLLGLDMQPLMNIEDKLFTMQFDLIRKELIWISQNAKSDEVFVFNALGQMVLRHSAGWSILSLKQLQTGYYNVMTKSSDHFRNLGVFVF